MTRSEEDALGQLGDHVLRGKELTRLECFIAIKTLGFPASRTYSLRVAGAREWDKAFRKERRAVLERLFVDVVHRFAVPRGFSPPMSAPSSPPTSAPSSREQSAEPPAQAGPLETRLSTPRPHALYPEIPPTTWQLDLLRAATAHAVSSLGLQLPRGDEAVVVRFVDVPADAPELVSRGVCWRDRGRIGIALRADLAAWDLAVVFLHELSHARDFFTGAWDSLNKEQREARAMRFAADAVDTFEGPWW